MKSPPDSDNAGPPLESDKRADERLDKGPPTGRRVLVAEDEFLVWLLLEEELHELGYTTVGPFASVSEAREASLQEKFDFAILDVNLAGELVFPLADEFSSRGIPFIFASGYGSMALPERHRERPRLAKPYDRTSLVGAIDQLGRASKQAIKPA